MTAEVGSFSQNDDNYQWFIEEINVQNMKQFTKRTYKGLGMTKEKIDQQSGLKKICFNKMK